MSNKKKKLYKKIRGIKIYKKQTCKKLEKSSLVIKSVSMSQKDSHISKNLHINFSFKIIFLILCLCLLSGVIFLVVKLIFNDNKASFIHISFNYKNYTIGEEVNFLKKKWYVIEDTNKDNSYIFLLGTDLLDLNNDNLIDHNDRCEYKSIKKILLNFNDDGYSQYVDSIRLLSSSEYVLLRNKMNLGYFWDKPNFLSGNYDDNWWIDSEKQHIYYSVNLNGTYSEENENSINYIRPVIKTLKIYLK